MIELATRPTSRADASEDAWSSMVDAWFTDGVQPGQFNGFRPYGDGAGGLNMKIASGKGWVKGFHGEKNSLTTMPLEPASGSFPRLDRAVLRMVRTPPATLYLVVKTGTPASNPTLPGLTKDSTTWEADLGHITVGAGATSIGAGAVVDAREYSVARSSEHVGFVGMWLGQVAPEGWLMLRGQSVATADYRALAAFFGVTGSSFTLPDFRQRVPRGANLLSNTGLAGGANQVTLVTANMPRHRHGVLGDTGLRFVVTGGGATFRAPTGAPPGQDVTFSNMDLVGNNQPFNIIPSHIQINFIIKAH